VSVRGSIKWYSMNKGFGFIVPDDGSADVFIHQTVVATARINPHDMGEGRAVVIETEDNKGKLRAKSIALA
jgi:cold shock CspA family protein